MSSVALARREAALERKEMAARAAARIAKIQDMAKGQVVKARAALDGVKESSQVAIATNGAARVGGMAFEAYARRHIDADKAKLIGPAATLGSIALYSIGMVEKKASTQYMYFAAAGVMEGMASRFVIDQIDRILDSSQK
jgi:hypothetical protein